MQDLVQDQGMKRGKECTGYPKSRSDVGLPSTVLRREVIPVMIPFQSGENEVEIVSVQEWNAFVM